MSAVRKEDRLAVDLLREMGDLPVPEPTRKDCVFREQRLVASVERQLAALEERQARRRGRRQMAWVLAFAAIVVLAVGAWVRVQPFESAPVAARPALHVISGTASVLRMDGVRARAEPGAALQNGDELVTETGSRVGLTLSDGAEVELSEKTRVRLNEQKVQLGFEALELSSGRVSLKVPRLQPGHRLSVITPDAIVTVHGTRFSVDVQRKSDARVITRVEVEDGRVEVVSGARHMLLGRGESWSSDSNSEHKAPAADAHSERAAIPAVPPAEAAAKTARGRRARSAIAPSEAARPAPDASQPESTLAQENQLFEAALRRAHAGQPERALGEIDAFLVAYPESPLSENARVARFRLLQTLGRKALAAQAARRYLSDYPSGFARAEAKRLALDGAADPP
jgi:ferric-dicitrate binding protein FerR (iron transport regulator)